MTKLTKEFVNTLELDLINVSSVLNNTTLNDSLQANDTTQNSDEQSSPQKLELNSSQTSEQQETNNSTEGNENLSENGGALENTKADSISETIQTTSMDDKLGEIVIEKDFNYVGTLQELCVKKQLTPPLYGLEKVDGPPHCRTFQTFCEVGPHREVVTSANKKLGKQLAAARILERIKMDGDLPDYASNQSTLASSTTTTSSIAPVTTATDSIDDIDETVAQIMNPVGYLQEHCVKNRITPPKYGIDKFEGAPHCPIFYTFCEVGPYREVVSSNSKKAGKELVARKIIMLLKK